MVIYLQDYLHIKQQRERDRREAHAASARRDRLSLASITAVAGFAPMLDRGIAPRPCDQTSDSIDQPGADGLPDDLGMLAYDAAYMTRLYEQANLV